MPSDEIRYARARAVEERQRASAAANPQIRAIHLEFAARYDQLAGSLNTANEMQLSRDAVARSLALLKATRRLVRT